MPDSQTVAALLLVFGPLLGAVPVANPRLVRIWAMSREDHVATVGANRRGWQLLNAGFVPGDGRDQRGARDPRARVGGR